VTIPKITGPDILRAILDRTKELPRGSVFSISLFDSYDLFKLEREQLIDEFDFSEPVADLVITGLRRECLTELGKAIGINLLVDKKRTDSLIKNAGIIRSAGALQDEEESLEDTLEFFHELRHDHRKAP
jgi:hypothetical protein